MEAKKQNGYTAAVDSTQLVSVIIPAYNAESLIGETLQSAIDQSYTKLEILVVDDGSSDATAAVVEDWCRRDGRIRLIRQENRGVCGARNTGIAEAKGEYLAFLDADDLWRSDKIRRQVERFLQGGESLGMVYSLSLIIDMEGRLIRDGLHRITAEGDVFVPLIEGNFMGNGSSVMVRADCVREVGGYVKDLPPGLQNCTDWEFYIAVAERYTVGLVPYFDVGYRHVEDSLSKNPSLIIDAYHRIFDPIQARRTDLPSQIFRRGKTSILLWQLSHQKRLSKTSFGLLAMMIRNDPFLFFRPEIARVIYPHAIKKIVSSFRWSRNTSVDSDTASVSFANAPESPYDE